MTRLGAGIALLVVLAIAAFASMLSFGPSPQRRSAPKAAAEQPAALALYPGQLVLPVRGIRPSQVADSWHDSRGEGTRVHLGNDIMAPGGTPVLAAVDGVVEKLYYSHGGGGITLYERAPDGRTMFYYAHLSGYAPGMAEGRRVRAGEPIAFVGDTGNAGPGNTHLHFGVYRMAPGQRWWQGTAVNPYPLLARAAVAR